MAYQITLTKAERNAIDWVGHRYSNGDDLFRLLMEGMPITSVWSQQGDITFDLPEHVAWQIKENAEQEEGDGFPCFDDTLTTKFLVLIVEIV